MLRTAASGHWRERRPGTRRKRSFLLPSGLPFEWKTGTGWTEEEESRGGRVEVVVEVTVVVGLDVGVVLAIVKVVVVVFCIVLAIVEVVVVFSILSSSLNRFLAWRVKLGDWK